MRKTLLFLFLSSVMSAFAQYTGDGYYRVQNVGSERYIVVVDDYGKLNYTTSDADLNAIRTYKGFDEYIVSNPGSIIYIEKNGSENEYILYSQGTNTYSIVGIYLKLHENGDGSYKAYASYSGMTKYLADEEGNYNPGMVNTGGGSSKTEYISNWYIIPVSAVGTNYFGLTPEFTVGDSNYLTFYASFPFSFASEGMTAYYVDKVVTAADGFGMAVWKEITDETIPAATPVIVKCSSTEPTNNRLNVLSSSSTTVSGNYLKGVYFCNNVGGNHRDVVQYDSSTMRILGLTSDGELGFVSLPSDSIYYIPANNAYLKVPEETGKVPASEFQLVTEEEYEELLSQHTNAGIEEVIMNDNSGNINNNLSGVYTLTGIKLSESNTLPEGIASGIYIVGGKKVVVR